MLLGSGPAGVRSGSSTREEQAVEDEANQQRDSAATATTATASSSSTSTFASEAAVPPAASGPTNADGKLLRRVRKGEVPVFETSATADARAGVVAAIASTLARAPPGFAAAADVPVGAMTPGGLPVAGLAGLDRADGAEAESGVTRTRLNLEERKAARTAKLAAAAAAAAEAEEAAEVRRGAAGLAPGEVAVAKMLKKSLLEVFAQSMLSGPPEGVAAATPVAVPAAAVAAWQMRPVAPVASAAAAAAAVGVRENVASTSGKQTTAASGGRTRNAAAGKRVVEAEEVQEEEVEEPRPMGARKARKAALAAAARAAGIKDDDDDDDDGPDDDDEVDDVTFDAALSRGLAAATAATAAAQRRRVRGVAPGRSSRVGSGDREEEEDRASLPSRGDVSAMGAALRRELEEIKADQARVQAAKEKLGSR